MINLKVKIQHNYETKNINCIRSQFILFVILALLTNAKPIMSLRLIRLSL